MTAEDIELMLKEMEQAFKKEIVDICPNCNEITNVKANPYYYHKCHCGWEGDYYDCIYKYPIDFAREILMKHLVK
jgi:hypothetical protein